MSAKRFSTLPTCLLLLLSLLISSASADVEAVRGKKYPLTKKHGPWMVMVASIRDVEEDRRVKDGLSAEEAANELVYQLRLLGIPAYTYQLEEKLGEISSTGDSSSRKFVAQHGYISVLAGNFPSNTDAEAKKVLQYIKTKFKPDFLLDPKNGGILPRTPGRPSPLSRAFLTANPLYEGEVRDGEEDSFIVDLNSGQKYSLLPEQIPLHTCRGHILWRKRHAGQRQRFRLERWDSLKETSARALMTVPFEPCSWRMHCEVPKTRLRPRLRSLGAP
jgi:hypothetical protein